MIAMELATRQALRMSGLPGYPAREEAEDEMVLALQRSSRDLEHAARIVSRWLESNRFCPTPADIYTLARETDRETDPKSWKCAHCDGTGWEPCWQLITWRNESQKDVEYITEARYEELRGEVSGRPGEQVAMAGRRRCLHCKQGRIRAEDEQRDVAEAKAKG